MVSTSAESCHDPERRRSIRTHGSNGIDYVEVGDDHLTLTVHCLNHFTTSIAPANVRITGGVRVRDIKAIAVRLHGPDDATGDNCIEITIDRPGDTSTYSLSLVDLDADGEPTDQPLPGIDLRYARADFSFRLSETTDVDCRQPDACPAQALPAPEINYLARDYGSFRQMILDRLAVTAPGWREQHVPDTAVAVVEILAYVADHLSYYQDAVATEAYLGTARQRISVRRHARLVDYAMHEGCNARAFIFVHTSGDVTIEDPASLHFLAGHSQAGLAGSRPSPEAITSGMHDRIVVFEPVAELAGQGKISLFDAHNEISFHTWGDRLCCLPAGSTSATLCDGRKRVTAGVGEAKPSSQAQERRSARKRSAKASAEDVAQSTPPRQSYSGAGDEERRLNLKPGDILLFEEVKGPFALGRGNSGTDEREAPDPARRHLVRLTGVKRGFDPLLDQHVLHITWADDDALPFALRLSDERSPPGEADLSVARGNMILADHCSWTGQGGRIVLEELSPVEPGQKFRPVLKQGPLTFCDSKSGSGATAKRLLQDPRAALPDLVINSIPPTIDGAEPLFSFADLRDPGSLTARLAGDDKVSLLNFRDRLSIAPADSAKTARPTPPDDVSAVAAQKDKLRSLLRTWSPRRDLLSSNGSDLHFVVEMDDQGSAHVRFGDGRNGRAPEIGESFAATYRVGVGSAGNVGADTITQIVLGPNGPEQVSLAPRNPLPSMGGIDPEPIEKVKLLAPKAYQSELARAVSADDYARLAERNLKVQRAAAELRWTGTRYEAHVVVDPLGTEAIDPALLRQIRADLYRYRRIGHDVIVAPPTYVPLDVAISVHVLAGHARGHIETVLRGIFSDGRLPGGGLGVFHPDNLTFGASIYASQLVAAAQRVKGVESVVVTRLKRRFQAPDQEIENGVLPIGPLEIARVGANRASPENGRFVLTVRGGQ